MLPLVRAKEKRFWALQCPPFLPATSQTTTAELTMPHTTADAK